MRIPPSPRDYPYYEGPPPRWRQREGPPPHYYAYEMPPREEPPRPYMPPMHGEDPRMPPPPSEEYAPDMKAAGLLFIIVPLQSTILSLLPNVSNPNDLVKLLSPLLLSRRLLLQVHLKSLVRSLFWPRWQVVIESSQSRNNKQRRLRILNMHPP